MAEDPGPFVSMTRGIQLDFDRTASVLNALDTMAAKWNKKDFFKTLALRIAYGVRPELVDLCRIPNIGRVRAEKLHSAGFRKPSDLLLRPDQVKKILNMKDDKIKEIIESASSIN